MLRSVPSSLMTSPPLTSSRLDKIARRARQIVVPAFELLQVLVIDQPSLPQVVEHLEVWPRRAQGFSVHGMAVRHVVHAIRPGCQPVVLCRHPVAQRALYGSWRLLPSEVAEAVCLPLVFVRSQEPTAQVPERTLVDRCPNLGLRDRQDTVVVFEQPHAREVASKTSAY